LVEAFLKLGLLTNRHIFIPDTYIIDNAPLREILADSRFKCVLGARDLDDSPPIVIGLRDSAEKTNDVIDYWLTKRIPLSSLVIRKSDGTIQNLNSEL